MNPCPEIVQPWWYWYPYVGTFITILGGLGVVVSLFRGEKANQKEKIAWSILMLLLVFLELRSIRLDGHQHDRDQARVQCLQLEGFKEVAGGITASIATSQTQFNKTMEKLNQTLSTETNTFNQTRPYADVEFDRYVEDPLNPLTLSASRPIGMNFFYKNLGKDKALDIWKMGRIYVASSDESIAKSVVIPQFEKSWEQVKRSKTPGKVLGIGDPPRADNFDFSGFTPNEISDILSGSSKIYFLFRVQYSDRTGSWISEHCDVSKPDIARSMLTQRHCIFFNEPRKQITLR